MAGLDPAIHALLPLAQIQEIARTLSGQRHAVKEYIQLRAQCRPLTASQ
jgi:hypothetical protein